MKKIIILSILVMFILNVSGQNIEECGIDDNPKLTKIESEFLSSYLQKNRNEFNFTDKKILIVTGNSGNRIGTKKQYFTDIKKWSKKGNEIATTLIIFNETEKLKSGFDGILTLWVKFISDRRKRIIINNLEVNK